MPWGKEKEAPVCGEVFTPTCRSGLGSAPGSTHLFLEEPQHVI